MKPYRIFWVLFVIFSIACYRTSPQSSAPDTPENRGAAADRYLQVTPPEELMADMMEKLAASVPEPKRQEEIDLLTKHLDLEAMRQIMRNSLIKHFTVKELDALAQFYGSPEGKSVMKKMGIYLADAMPSLMAELQKAYERASKKPE